MLVHLRERGRIAMAHQDRTGEDIDVVLECPVQPRMPQVIQAVFLAVLRGEFHDLLATLADEIGSLALNGLPLVRGKGGEFAAVELRE